MHDSAIDSNEDIDDDQPLDDADEDENADDSPNWDKNLFFKSYGESPDVQRDSSTESDKTVLSMNTVLEQRDSLPDTPGSSTRVITDHSSSCTVFSDFNC